MIRQLLADLVEANVGQLARKCQSGCSVVNMENVRLNWKASTALHYARMYSRVRSYTSCKNFSNARKFIRL